MGNETTVEAVREASERLKTLLNDVSEAQMRAPTVLPAWTRGHLVAHVIGVARGARRQVDTALAGDLIDFYDGGRPGRAAFIEANAGRPAGELVAEVMRDLDDLTAVWDRVEESDWDRPVRYRDGTLVAVLLTVWREWEIHAVDLDLGVGPDTWSPEFCAHAIDFLTPRVPEGVRIELDPSDGQRRLIGEGESVRLTGRLGDLTAWLAGRAPAGVIDSSTGTLPELGPWP